MATSPATSPGRFPEFIKGLISAIGTQNRLVPGWLCLFMQVRVQRIGNRIAHLFEKLRAGTYRVARPRVRAPETTARVRTHIPPNIRSAVPADARIPRRSAWV